MFNIMNLLVGFGMPLTRAGQATAAIVEYLPVCTLTPRFILSVRELYARDLEGRSFGMDTGFGLSSLSGAGASRTTLVFVGSGQDEEAIEQDEDIPMEEL